MASACYTRLPEGSVRLLRLLPPDPDAPSQIKCRISSFALLDSESAHAYEALSYVWGSTVEGSGLSIAVNDHEFAVTPNLYAALLHLRDAFVERVLWIDALCINQNDDIEKGYQVQSMARIYAKANRVIVWLGEATADSGSALRRLLEAADTLSQEQQLHEITFDEVQQPQETAFEGREQRSPVLALLARPWFRRIWVLQEAAAARNIQIKCGPDEIDGYTFCLGLDALNLLSTANTRLQGLVRPATYLIRGAIFRPRLSIDDSVRFSLRIRPLAELVDMYHTRRATDPRDKVYALFGMSSDDPTTKGFSADYEASWDTVMRKLVHFCFSDQTSVETWGNNEAAAIQADGCILGQVSSVRGHGTLGDSQVFEVFWNENVPSSNRWQTRWTFQATAKPVQEGDAIGLLEGSKHPCILRFHGDYASLVVSTVPLMGEALPLRSASVGTKAFTVKLFLIWDWQTSQSPDDYLRYLGTLIHPPALETGPHEYLQQATRLFDMAVVLRHANRELDADKRILAAGKICGEAFTTWGDAIMQRGMEDLLLRDEGDEKPSYRGKSWKPLYGLAGSGCDATIRWFIDAGKVSPDRDGDFLLWWAVKYGARPVVELLLDTEMVSLWEEICYAAATPNEPSPAKNLSLMGILNGATMLTRAVESDHQGVIQWLMLTGVVDVQTTIRDMAERGLKEQLGILLDSLHPRERDEALRRAAREERQLAVRTIVKAQDRGIFWVGDNLSTLEAVASKGDKAVAKLLLEAKAENPDLLSMIVSYRLRSVLELILEDRNAYGLDITKTLMYSGCTALHHAIYLRYDDIAELLINSGKANVEATDEFGRTPLHLAVRLKEPAIIELLIEKGGASIYALDHENDSPLKIAISSGDSGIAKLVQKYSRSKTQFGTWDFLAGLDEDDDEDDDGGALVA